MASTHLSKLEQDLLRVPGVRSARVIGGDVPTEIHVVTTSKRSPKQVVRDVQSLAAAGFGIPIDHRIVSVVQLDDPPPTEPSGNGEGTAERAPQPQAASQPQVAPAGEPAAAAAQEIVLDEGPRSRGRPPARPRACGPCKQGRRRLGQGRIEVAERRDDRGRGRRRLRTRSARQRCFGGTASGPRTRARETGSKDRRRPPLHPSSGIQRLGIGEGRFLRAGFGDSSRGLGSRLRRCCDRSRAGDPPGNQPEASPVLAFRLPASRPPVVCT